MLGAGSKEGDGLRTTTTTAAGGGGGLEGGGRGRKADVFAPWPPPLRYF